MVPAAFVEQLINDILPHLESGDILVVGGNSYYIDDAASRAGFSSLTMPGL